jgi:alkylation response protein AidB-like acyl-CoA dehydrogenase
MNAVLQMTRDYLCQREQFGVKIGTFQALQHRAVDMFVETELARSTVVRGALAAGDPDPEARARGVSVAKVQLAVGGRFSTQQSIQLHGGIGITDEADVGLYFKRMHVLNALFGDEEHHVARYARGIG